MINSRSELRRLQTQDPGAVEKAFDEMRAQIQDQDLQLKQMRAELNAARCANATMRQALGKIADVAEEFCGERI